MVSKTSDSSSKSRRSHGEEDTDGIGGLLCRLNQLRKQIQAERVSSIKERIENNRKKLEAQVLRIRTATSQRNGELSDDHNNINMLLSRMKYPACKFNGLAHVLGDRDYVPSREVVSATIKLPFAERLPRYTSWIFLDRNQRMTEDQSVVGRRRIYYDQDGSEALICSDSEDDTLEPEDEKHDFSEGEDRIIWLVGQEYELGEEALKTISQFLGIDPLEIQERFKELKEKNEQSITDTGDSGSNLGISLDKSLSAALDSFDNLFCRRCLVFDCRLHGCSQTLIHASEKQPYWSEYEGDRNPCSEQCYLRLRTVKDVREVGSIVEPSTNSKSSEGKDKTASSSVVEEANADSNNSVLSAGALALDFSAPGKHIEKWLGKRKEALTEGSDHSSDDMTDSSSKKQKISAVLDMMNESSDSIPVGSSVKEGDSECGHPSKVDKQEQDELAAKNAVVPDCSHEQSENIDGDGKKAIAEAPEPNESSSEWRTIEKELYLKGVEIFGRNSCLIARNLLSGLKTCMEVSSYMRKSGASVFHRSGNSSLLLEDDRNDADGLEQEMPARTRLFRRRGKTRRLKYSSKSAGHPSVWKRIADGKNQSSKQYTPCGCQSMCGKLCPCLTNGTCCEKYCGCSKSCKNRFRGCHCAKSQCRSRQCPCFAAGRECDPDVCRNCWISCGDGTLGEPPKCGEGQCGNMRLFLRQQQRILLAKSDVAGWGAFLKNSVNKNEYLGEYTGELISHREADKRGKIYDRANSSFLFDLNDQYVLDAYRKGDKLKFANHSSNPNCYAKVMFVAGDHRVGIFAKERIEASEELFYDYRYGPDQAPAWARKPEGSKKDESSVNQGRARKHQSH